MHVMDVVWCGAGGKYGEAGERRPIWGPLWPGRIGLYQLGKLGEREIRS